MAETQPRQAHSDDAAHAIEQHAVALGSESPKARRAKVVVPWLMSLALHGGLVLLGSLVTWSVVMMSDDREPPMITADFQAMHFDPVAVLDAAPTLADERDLAPSELEIDEALIDDPFDLDAPPLDLMPESLTGPPPSDFAPPPVQGAAEFLGVTTSNAQRIVYIIDASGGMIPYLRIVLMELARSLDGLADQQSFAVIFFQRNEYVMVPPHGRWNPATSSEKRRVLQWIDDNVIPSGRSNPLSAFEVALGMNPDAIFLLSDNITGSGIYEVDQKEVLARLDELNPADRLTGKRRTQINCIQFLDPDPLDTLRRIADEHGGPRAYKFLGRAELGLGIREPR